MTSVHYDGLAQYQTTGEGDAVDAWLTTWEATNAGVLLEGSGHTLSVLDPPNTTAEDDPGPYIVQIILHYSFEGDPEGSYELLSQLACPVYSSCGEDVSPTGAIAGGSSGFTSGTDNK